MRPIVAPTPIFARLPSGLVTAIEHVDDFPIGTVVDASNGRVELTSSSIDPLDPNTVTQTAQFFDGVFTVGQALMGDDTTTLDLPAPTCTPATSGATSGNDGNNSKKKKKKKKKKGRALFERAATASLWGKGKGKFGRAAIVVRPRCEAATWLTQESCAGTQFTLTEGGPLEIDDFGLGGLADVTLQAIAPGGSPRSYLAARPPDPAPVAVKKKCPKGKKLKKGKCVRKKKN